MDPLPSPTPWPSPSPGSGLDTVWNVYNTLKPLSEFVDRISFPAEVAAILAQITPVVFLAVIIELRGIRREAPAAIVRKNARMLLGNAFLWFVLAESMCVFLVAVGGMPPNADGLVTWLLVGFTNVMLLITLWHTLRDDPDIRPVRRRDSRPTIRSSPATRAPRRLRGLPEPRKTRKRRKRSRASR